MRASYWIVFPLIIVILSLLALGKYPVFSLQGTKTPDTSGYGLSCTPHPLSISNDEIFHHTLSPCSDFKEENTVLRADRTQARLESIQSHINAFGFRNREYQLEKGPSTIRIVILGDSFVYGYGLEREEAFYTRLETLLNTNSLKTTEVWNIGVPSWATAIQYFVLRDRIFSYSPDYILLFLDDSDFADNFLYTQMVVRNGTEEMGVRQNDLGSGMAYYEARLEVWESISDGNSSSANKGYDELQDTTLSYVEKMHGLSREKGVPFEVILYPYANTSSGYERNILSRFYQGLSDRSIDYLTLYPYLLNKSGYYSQEHKHWNENGSVYVADLLYRHMKDDTLYEGLEIS